MPAPALRSLAIPLALGALGGYGLVVSLNYGLVLALVAVGAPAPEVALAGGRPPGIGTEQVVTVLFLAGLLGAVLAIPVRRARAFLDACAMLALATLGPSLALLATQAATGAARSPLAQLPRNLAVCFWGAGVGILLVFLVRAVVARRSPEA